MIQSYLISGYIIEIHSCIPYKISDSFLPFLYNGSQKADIIVYIDDKGEKVHIDGKIVFDNKDYRIYQMGKEYYREARFLCETRISIMNENQIGNIIRCSIAKDMLQREWTTHDIFAIVGLEFLLMKCNTMILHSSLIDWNNKGIIFSAPSRTGKSTQAKLWEQYEGAEILNGDRSILRQIGDRWYAYGSPYAGSSCIYKNQKVPVKAFVILEQGDYNIVERLKPAQGFRWLYSQMMCNYWNQGYMEKLSDNLIDMLSSIPVYKLVCRPDQEAVEVLKRKLGQEDD